MPIKYKNNSTSFYNTIASLLKKINDKLDKNEVI